MGVPAAHGAQAGLRNDRDGPVAPADEIYNRPADLFVANFTGASNELAGTLVERNGEFGVVDLGGGNRAEAALLAPLAPGDAVRIALRPENMRSRNSCTR